MTRLQSNQYYALVILVLSLGYIVMGLSIEEGFYNDPVGPDVWVIGVGVCLVFLSLLLLFFPAGYIGSFPQAREIIKRIPFFMCVVLYSYALPFLGFIISTPLLMVCIGLIFRAKLVPAIISAVSMTAGCYLVFDVILDIALPSGLL